MADLHALPPWEEDVGGPRAEREHEDDPQRRRPGPRPEPQADHERQQQQPDYCLDHQRSATSSLPDIVQRSGTDDHGSRTSQREHREQGPDKQVEGRGAPMTNVMPRPSPARTTKAPDAPRSGRTIWGGATRLLCGHSARKSWDEQSVAGHTLAAVRYPGA